MNPFVSMVGVAGLLMFLLEPLVPAPQPIRPPWEWLLATIIFAAMSVNFVGALDNFSREDRVSSWIPRREGLDDLVRAMTDNVIADRPREYRYAVAHIGSLSADVIFNPLAYDQKLPVDPNATVVYGNATLAKCYQAVSTQVEWNASQGLTDDEKIDRLANLLDSRCDFLPWPIRRHNCPHLHTSTDSFLKSTGECCSLVIGRPLQDRCRLVLLSA